MDKLRVACALTVINQTPRPLNGIKTYDLALVAVVHPDAVYNLPSTWRTTGDLLRVPSSSLAADKSQTSL